MENFDMSKISPELISEIKSCTTTDELKTLFVSKNFYVPDSKLEAILKLSGQFDELTLEELEMISGGGGCCHMTCEMNCDNYRCNVTTT